MATGTHTLTPPQLRSRLRLVALGLVLAGSSFGALRRRMIHLRALILEEESAMWANVGEPGALLTMAGVALLELSNELEREHTR